MNPYVLYMAKHAAAENGIEARSNEAQMKGREFNPVGDAARNVAYGLMSSPRSAGPMTPVGASVGGVIDGFLLRPVLSAGINLADKGLHALYGKRSDS